MKAVRTKTRIASEVSRKSQTSPTRRRRSSLEPRARTPLRAPRRFGSKEVLREPCRHARVIWAKGMKRS